MVQPCDRSTYVVLAVSVSVSRLATWFKQKKTCAGADNVASMSSSPRAVVLLIGALQKEPSAAASAATGMLTGIVHARDAAAGSGGWFGRRPHGREVCAPFALPQLSPPAATAVRPPSTPPPFSLHSLRRLPCTACRDQHDTSGKNTHRSSTSSCGPTTTT